MASNHRIAYLDGLRGIAALIVVIHHCILAFVPYYANGDIRYLGTNAVLPTALPGVLWSGNLSVCIFFVLSGYVLAPMTLGSRSTGFSLIVRRLVRLGLPIVGSLTFAYIVWKSGWLDNVPAGHASGSVGWLATFYHTRPRFLDILLGAGSMPFMSAKNHYDPVVWTMHWEYLGSFGIFIVYTLFRRRRVARILAMALLALVLRSNYYIDFVAGALLADLNYASLAQVMRPLWRRILIVTLLLGATDLGLYLWSNGTGTPWHWLDVPGDWLADRHAERAHMPAAILLLGAILISPRLQAFLALRPIAWLGRVSFALYLVHFPILCSLSSWVFVAMRATHSIWPSFVIAFAVTLAASLATAWLFTLAIDEPATRLSQRVGRATDAWLEKVWNRHTTRLVGRIWHRVQHGLASLESRWSRFLSACIRPRIPGLRWRFTRSTSPRESGSSTS
jgi:peptidoglycan/LPS O-acetylase OafA/YrhL